MLRYRNSGIVGDDDVHWASRLRAHEAIRLVGPRQTAREATGSARRHFPLFVKVASWLL
jgi:hypothetical protein